MLKMIASSRSRNEFPPTFYSSLELHEQYQASKIAAKEILFKRLSF